MEAEPRSDTDAPVRCVDPMPGDEATGEVGDKGRRLPIPEFFTRRAFLSKDTGRWHVLPRRRDRHDGTK
jgi:hypothetical protein